MEVEAAKLIGAGLATIALAGAGIGIGLVGGNAMNAISRQPDASDKITGPMILLACLLYTSPSPRD